MADLPGSYNDIGASGFYDWMQTGPRPEDVRRYAETYGYSPTHLANFYNVGGNISSRDTERYITPQQAAVNLGVTSAPEQVLGEYWSSRDPRTGQSALDNPHNPANFSNWTPGQDYQYSQTGVTIPRGGGDTVDGNSILDVLFQEGLYPQSGGTSQGTSISGNNSVSSGSSFGSTFSGLSDEQRAMILDAILPELVRSTAGLSGAPDRYAQTAQRMYEQQARRSLEETLPQVIEAMGSRGLLGSSLTKDALAEATQAILGDMGQRSLESQLNAEQMRLNVPTVLGGLVGLGQYSSGINASNQGSVSSGYGLTQNQSENYSIDPLSPYRLLSDFITNNAVIA